WWGGSTGRPSTSVRCTPTPSDGCERIRRTASLVAGAFAKRLALVRMPCAWASKIPSLTPTVRPRSSAFTTSRRGTVSAFMTDGPEANRDPAAARPHGPPGRIDFLMYAWVFLISRGRRSGPRQETRVRPTAQPYAGCVFARSGTGGGEQSRGPL